MSDDASRESNPPVQPTPPGVTQGGETDATKPIQPVPPGVDPSDARSEKASSSGSGVIQPAPPGVEPEPAASSGETDLESTQRIQPVPPDAAPSSASGSATGVDVPTAEMEVDVAPAEAKPVQSTPSSLYDVPWQPADEPIPEWIAEKAAENPAPAATSVAPAAQPAGVAPGQGSGYAAAAHQSAPPRSAYVGGAAAPPSNRPRRAGIIAASVVGLAIVLVGGGVIALLATRGNGEGAQAGGAATTIADVVNSTISPPSVTPSTPVPGPTTTPPTPVPTTPPPTPTTPTTGPPPPGSPNTVPGDLSLAEPMRRPACDGQYIVITANAVTPDQYQRQVVEAQQRFVGSAYLKTDQTCPSLRPFDDLGNAIYSVYYGPFPTLADACRIRTQVGGDSYIKILDQVTPFTKIWDCE